jgi:transposase
VQAGFEAHPAPRPTPEGEVKKRGRPTQPPPVNVLLRLRDCKDQGLACMSDFRIPFANNQGERDIRLVQGNQPGAGGFRTLEGAKCFGRIRGSISTARKQAKNGFEAIREAFDGSPFIPSSARQYRPIASGPSTYLGSYQIDRRGLNALVSKPERDAGDSAPRW